MIAIGRWEGEDKTYRFYSPTNSLGPTPVRGFRKRRPVVYTPNLKNTRGTPCTHNLQQPRRSVQDYIYVFVYRSGSCNRRKLPDPSPTETISSTTTSRPYVYIYTYVLVRQKFENRSNTFDSDDRPITYPILFTRVCCGFDVVYLENVVSKIRDILRYIFVRNILPVGRDDRVCKILGQIYINKP